MEIQELPDTEERDEILYRPEAPPVNFAEQEIDLAAFQLWRGASRPDDVLDESADAAGSD